MQRMDSSEPFSYEPAPYRAPIVPFYQQTPSSFQASPAAQGAMAQMMVNPSVANQGIFSADVGAVQLNIAQALSMGRQSNNALPVRAPVAYRARVPAMGTGRSLTTSGASRQLRGLFPRMTIEELILRLRGKRRV